MNTATVILGLVLALLIGLLVYWGNHNPATVKKLEGEAEGAVKAEEDKLKNAAKAEVAAVEKKL